MLALRLSSSGNLICTRYHTAISLMPRNQQACLFSWLHTVSPGDPLHVARTQTRTAEWTFTIERAADPGSIAIEYDCCNPHPGRHRETPICPLHNKCPTVRGDKEEKE